MKGDKKSAKTVRPKKRVIKFETKMTLGSEGPDFHLEKKRAAIKAALLSATSGLAATTSGIAAHGVNLGAADGGTPPWGEVIIEPIWYEKNPKLGEIISGAGEVRFWE
jgi:hypothetical protein